MNATVFISGQYGKSIIPNDQNAYSINSKGELFVYHTLPEITSIMPSKGGINGKTHVHIKGNSFDAYPGKTRVKVGKTDCEIVEINSTDLTCLTPKQSDMVTSIAGPRGLLYEAWINTETYDYTTLTTTVGDYRKLVLDNSTARGRMFYDQTKGFTARLSGFFVAPYTGEVAFYLHCSANCSLYWSNSTDPTNTELLKNWPEGNEVKSVGHSSRTRALNVVEGKEYYMAAFHTQTAINSKENFLQVSLWEFKTNYHTTHSSQIKNERQVLELTYSRNLETQRITMSGMIGVDKVTFMQSGKASPNGFPVDIGKAKQEWKGTFQTMLEMKCNAIRVGTLFYQNYENVNFHLNGASGSMNDQIIPFCGKRSLERQTRLMNTYGKPSINANRYKFVCFAVKGKSLLGHLNIRVKWQRFDDRYFNTWVALADLWIPSEEWQYNCYNWAELVRNTTYSGLTNMKEGSMFLEIDDIITPVDSTASGYWFHDEFSITEQEVSLTRDFGAVPSENVYVQNVDVTFNTNDSSFDVVIDPRSCNDEKDDFGLFGISDADIVGLDLSSITDPEDKERTKLNYLKTNEYVTFSSSSWGGGTINIKRIKRGSRALKGTFSLTYNGKTAQGLPVNIDNEQFRQTLESELGLLGAHTWYWNQRCYNKMIPFELRYSLVAGNIETIVMDASNVIVDNEKQYKKIQMNASEDGGAMIEEPGGDFFRKVKILLLLPLICIYVDSIPHSKCLPEAFKD